MLLLKTLFLPLNNNNNNTRTPGAEDGSIICSQLNMNHCAASANHINEWLADPSVHNLQPSTGGGYGKITLIQEPYLRRNKVSNISKDFRIFRGINKGLIRSVIITTRNINGWILNQFSDADQVAIMIKTKKRTIVVASVYMPGDSGTPPPPKLMRELINYCKNNRIGFIIGTDANSHHTSWGSTDINNRGESLLDYIVSEELFILNKGAEPTFETINRKEVLDVTLSSNSLTNIIDGWKVFKGESFSDHKRIDFNLCETVKLNNSTFRNVRKTRWNQFRADLQDHGLNLTGNNLDTMAQELEDCIITAYHNNCKLSKGRVERKPPWWTAKLTELKREVFKCKRRADRTGLEATVECYRQAKREYKLEIKIAKGKGWQKFCSDMENLNSSARIQKVMKTGKKEELGSMKRNDGTFTTTPEETLNVLLDTHFPNCEEEQQHQGRNWDINLDEVDINQVVNEQSVRAAFSSFKPYKSPGLDNIYPALIQQGIDYLVSSIVHMYRECLTQGKSPKRWLESKVTFIPKPGKQDYSLSKNLRPINLASFLLKGLERLIHWFINSTRLRNNLNDKVFAYREGTSTEDPLHRLVYKIEKALEKNETAIVLFMDMDAAFSSASIKGILNNMERLGVQPIFLRWSEHMLSNRTVTAYLNDESASKEIDNGTPQGGILSTDYWNGDGDDLVTRLSAEPTTEINNFADDFSDLGVGICEFTIASNIQKNIFKSEEWAAENGLKFNSSKSKLMLFTKRKKYKKPKIFLYGQELEYVKEIKYLGLTLDDKLTWTKHIQNITTKATNCFMQCRSMMGKTWGLTPYICKWMYTALIRPIMSYGCMIWINSTYKISHIKKLRRVQRKACLSALNAMNSTPTAALELILNLEPIEIFLRSQALCTYLRVKRNNNWRHRPGEVFNKTNHGIIMEKLAGEISNLHLPADKMRYTSYLESRFQTHILPREVMNRVKRKPHPYQVNTISCFTDGSRYNDKSGSGYTIWSYEEHFQDYDHLGKYATVYQAEVQAIMAATTTMLNANITNQTINYFVDNQAAIQSLGKYCIKSSQVLNCKLAINELALNNDIHIYWIPGHSNHPGNEVADRLAKQGVEKLVHAAEPILPVSEAEIKQNIKNWATLSHQTNWRNLPYCRQTKMMIPSPDPKIWKKIQKYSRRNIMIITQMLTGHCTLQRHLTIMKIEEDPTCEQCCEDEETVEHFLCECPVFAVIRHHTLGKLFLEQTDLPGLKMSQILDFVKKTKRLVLD